MNLVRMYVEEQIYNAYGVKIPYHGYVDFDGLGESEFYAPTKKRYMAIVKDCLYYDEPDRKYPPITDTTILDIMEVLMLIYPIKMVHDLTGTVSITNGLLGVTSKSTTMQDAMRCYILDMSEKLSKPTKDRIKKLLEKSLERIE